MMAAKNNKPTKADDNGHGPLMRYPQAADYLSVSERTLWTMVDLGHIRAVQFGPNGAVRFSRRELDGWIDARLAD